MASFGIVNIQRERIVKVSASDAQRKAVDQYARGRSADKILAKHSKPTAAARPVKKVTAQDQRAQLLAMYAQKAAADERATVKKAADARAERVRAANAMDAYLAGK
ncbi:hypothetical protein PWR63_19370 [Paraburkholderia sp. A2WS-5]|uniref:hypothetical protein n=1 Tax=unclassified Paraburkholderia TaxID=2615204 RepID=UPI003B7E8BB6